MSDFPIMSTLLQPAISRQFKLEHFVIGEAELQYMRMRAAAGNLEYLGQKAGTFVRLKKGSIVMMSDTEMERRSNWSFLHYGTWVIL